LGLGSESPQPSMEELLRVIAELRAVNARLREVVESPCGRWPARRQQLRAPNPYRARLVSVAPPERRAESER
jgi:hypothetical protein